MGTKLQRILSRRVLRDLKSNFWRYMALLFLITLGMYMVVAMIGSAESIMWTVETGYEKNQGEDGQFGTFVPLSEEELGQITGKGVTLEEHFSLDYEVGETRIRVMKVRSQIDLFEVETGRNLEQDGEMLLEKLYAEANGLEVGSEITLGSSTFTVVGIGSLPDYDTPLEKLSDASSNSQKFGCGLVTEADYEALLAAGESFKTEDYVYAYRLNGKMTDEELQELLQSFELDRDKVTDIYFLDMLEELEETRRRENGEEQEKKRHFRREGSGAEMKETQSREAGTDQEKRMYLKKKEVKNRRLARKTESVPRGTASREMCTFLILNISSLQLIPVNMIAYRSRYGSAMPEVIVGPAILVTLASTAAAVVFCRIMDRTGARRSKSPER